MKRVRVLMVFSDGSVEYMHKKGSYLKHKNIDLFVCKSTKYKSKFMIGEKKTGRKIAEAYTKKEAIEIAKKRINKKGTKSVKERIEFHVENDVTLI